MRHFNIANGKQMLNLQIRSALFILIMRTNLNQLYALTNTHARLSTTPLNPNKLLSGFPGTVAMETVLTSVLSEVL